ncbi:MAG TPA: hypothetical protein PL009_07660 [Flavipsychrobacter sp.]|nr:hypothetical protein [Flavipsychrobacter sp.]
MPVSTNQKKRNTMVCKSYFLFAGLTMLLTASQITAQEYQSTTTTTTTQTSAVSWETRDMSYRGGSYDVLDTNYVPAYRMDQHRRFLNHEYNFPAKPRNMWEIGVGAGLYNVSGDVPTLMLWERGGYGFHAHVRKSWGYMFSTRLQYMYGVAKGLQWQNSENYSRNTAWYHDDGPGFGDNVYQPALMDPTTSYVTPAKDFIHYNFRMEAHQLNVDFMFNTNNISWHKARTGLSFYGFVGMGAFAYNTRINTRDANGNKYEFAEMVGDIKQEHRNRREIKRRLQSEMDNSYETDAETIRGVRRPTIFGNKTLDWAFSGGIGAQFKVSRLFNISIENRITFPHDDDLLDGQRWAEQVRGNPVFTQDNDMVNYFSVGINFNVGNARRNVEPLYWLNPLDYVYTEVSTPRHMRLPDPSLPDADFDGVTDQFDQCPGTPEGVPVDVNGCPMDTDGDGVPDYRDKQLITPTECQPVDEDGIGKCPCPDDCNGTATISGPCANIGSGAIVFDANSARLKPYNQARLASLAALMKANPECRVVFIGSGSGSKLQQQRSWDRVEAVIVYMTERHGIDRSRFIFQYGQPGDANTVMYRSAMEGEDGPSNVAPPFPNLRRD